MDGWVGFILGLLDAYVGGWAVGRVTWIKEALDERQDKWIESRLDYVEEGMLDWMDVQEEGGLSGWNAWTEGGLD